MYLLKTKFQIATFIAILFHACGLVGIVYFKSQLFIDLTPLNLLISFLLIFWTQEINVSFLIFILLAFLIGTAVEYIGINTNILFGKYVYGNSLGPKWNGVPWIIGVNWFIIIYCIGITMNMLHSRLSRRSLPTASQNNSKWSNLTVIIDGAILAVFFDWIIEPVAIRLGFWSWDNGIAPSFNYWCWFGISTFMLFIFQQLRFNKHNLFAVHLLLVQFMFFLLLRTFL